MASYCENSMSIYAACVAVLLVMILLSQPLAAEVNDMQPSLEGNLCPFVRAAAGNAQLESEAIFRLREAEILVGTEPDLAVAPLNDVLRTKNANRADRELFEKSLANWLFFEDLAPRQRTILVAMLSRCGTPAGRTAVHASIFSQLDASQRATFVGVTHAMLNTRLVDRQSGVHLGDALQLVQELVDIQGENPALPSDHQFQLIVRLTADALEKLRRAAGFERGENHVYHKDYPLSFRQLRNIGVRGEEAGLHICATRDGKLAEVHVDYRFGLLHLGPANSDVRAEGNHQRHVDRWPQVVFASRRVRVRRPVLH